MTAEPRRAGFSIVLNYRREDTAGHAGRLYDALVREFGEERVFMDIDAIDPGVDFVEVIERAVDSCDAFVSVIGSDWLSVKDSKGRRRLDNPEDYVRMEIEAALRRDVLLIPVLVQEADMPTAEDLPASLAPFARRNALELRDASWRHDVDRFVRTLREELEEQDEAGTTDGAPPVPGPNGDGDRRRFRRVAAAAATVGLVALALLALLLLRDGGNEEPEAGGGGGAPATDELIAVGAGGRIYVASPDGSGVEALRGTGFATAPDWSPDGERLAVSRGGNIWVVDSDGDGEWQLTRGPEVDNRPAWSPDGKRIAFDRLPEPGGRADIWLVSADVSPAPRELTRGPAATGAAPTWSPGGERIAFQRRFQIWVIADDGTSEERIDGAVEGAHLFPAWAPDNSRIAFVVTGIGRCEIVLLRPDGGNPTTLTPDGPSRCRDLAWSPDAQRIAFVGDDALWAIGRDGTGLEKLGEADGIGSPSWLRRS